MPGKHNPKFEKIASLFLRDTRGSAMDRLRQDMEKAFVRHPEETGETYLQHLRFTAKMCLRLIYTGVILIVHGLLPFVFTRTAGLEIERIYRIMKSRIPKKRREEIDTEPVRRKSKAAPRGTPCVAIIGGGFSGAMTLAQLVQLADGPMEIEWIEERAEMGLGIAYGTKEPVHLLNVRAERMGAFAGQPEGFYLWLQTEEGRAHHKAIWPEREISPETCAPRVLYAAYLRAIVAQILALASQRNIRVHTRRSRVRDAWLHDATTQRLTLLLDGAGEAQEIVTDALVLATGNLPPRSFSFQSGLVSSRKSYVVDIWNTDDEGNFPHHVNEFSPDTEIVVIGTGLTMVDSILTLKSRGYKGTITAISRNGWLPLPHAHAPAYPAWDWALEPESAPRTALELLRGLRAEVARAKREGVDWRSVVDSIRPVTQALWKQLPLREKRRFLDKLFTAWNIHRHRMAGDVHAELRAMQQSGALKIIAGKIYYVGSDADGLTVAYRKRGANRIETLRPALVLNCTGPEYDIAASDHELLKNLRDRELITVGPLRVGIETTASGTAKGKAPEAIFPIGTLLVGELLECTAVPELREQASKAAAQVLCRVQALNDSEGVEFIQGEWI